MGSPSQSLFDELSTDTEKKNKICPGCSTTFAWTTPHQKFCTRKCYVESNRAIAAAKTRAWYSKNKERVKLKNKATPKFDNCKRCGQIFRRANNQQFCGKNCAKEHRRISLISWRKKAYHERYKEQSKKRCLAGHYRRRATTPWMPLVAAAKVRAKQRSIPFDLTYEWASVRWTGLCEISRLPFDTTQNLRHCYSPSIDQINPGKGYTQDNCRFVIWAINAMKGTNTDFDILTIAKAICDHHRP